MQSIITRYKGATERRGARISAFASAGGTSAACRLSLPYDYALDADGNHKAAARELARRLSWAGRWHQGHLDKSREVFVREWYDGRDSFEIGGPKP